jgi:hypothetical protein
MHKTSRQNFSLLSFLKLKRTSKIILTKEATIVRNNIVTDIMATAAAVTVTGPDALHN